MTVFSGNSPKVKRKVRDFLNERSVGFVLQTTELGSSGERFIILIMEGEKVSIYLVRDELVLYLNSIYVITYREWEEQESEEPLLAGLVKKTPNSINPDSSGNGSPTSNELPASANYEKWISGLISGAYKTLEIVNNAAKVKSVSDSFIGLDVKNIYVLYKKTEVYLNVGTCRFWQDFITLLYECDELSIPKKDSLKIYIKEQNGDKAEVNADIDRLEAGKSYIVETESSLDEAKPKFNNLEEFFTALKEKKGETAIERVKEVFAKEDIDFEQLMETGDLAITDAELKECGIEQGGLRKAMLSLIKSNRK